MRKAYRPSRMRNADSRSGWRRLFGQIGCLGLFLFLNLSPLNASAFVNQDRVSTAKALSHYMMGYRYDLLGDVQKAALEYEKAAQFDKGAYLVHLRLGADYARLDLLNDAIKELKLVNKYSPEDLQSHYLLALIYSTQREYDLAAQEYEIILTSFSEAEPKNIEIYGYLGQLYYSQKKYAQAIFQFEKILELEPFNADIMYLLGSLYIEIDNNPKAVSILKRSIGIDPNHDGSLNTLGYLYADMGENLDQAVELINRALELSPGNGAYLDSLGWVYYKKEKYQQALKYFIQADEKLKDPVIYEHLGDTYYKLNNVEKAIKSWESSIQLLPGQNDVVEKINKAKNSRASR